MSGWFGLVAGPAVIRAENFQAARGGGDFITGLFELLVGSIPDDDVLFTADSLAEPQAQGQGGFRTGAQGPPADGVDLDANGFSRPEPLTEGLFCPGRSAQGLNAFFSMARIIPGSGRLISVKLRLLVTITTLALFISGQNYDGL